LYSTVKYYYPEPNLQDFPWDAFAYQGYKISTTSKNDKEFIKKTEKLFWTIAPGVQISKRKFDMRRITPKDTLRYSERAFWQHQGGLNVERALFSNASTLNYIHKKSTGNYKMIQIISKSKRLSGKKLRFSLMAKVEDTNDSVKVFSFDIKHLGKQRTENGKTISRISANEWSEWKDGAGEELELGVEIKAAGNEWRHYVVEFEYPDSVIFPRMTIYHPTKGTIYLDDLKLEQFENEEWEEIKIDNAGFEGYTSVGKVGGWETMYAFGALAVADSINAIEGKYCLKLPTVQDKLLYPPNPIYQPHVVLLPIGYKAYVPLQLYADEKTVFPVTDKNRIKNFAETLRRDSLNANQQAIACVMQTWAALYHDYSYREDDFENKLNRLLFQTVNKLDTTQAADLYTILAVDFLLWINDPHLRLEGGSKFLTDYKTRGKTINIPVLQPEPICLTETQCVVTSVIDNVKKIQEGDVILRINDISIDSLLQLYKAYNISRSIQERELKKLMTTYGKSEMTVQLLRNDKIVDVVFSTNTRQGYNIKPKEEREKYQTLQDSLKATTGLFYLNTTHPPEEFSASVIRNVERRLNQYHATDSLITELNQHKALILDVRGRPDNSNGILSFFNSCMGIDLNRDSDVIKTAFAPVAQFKYDTLNFTPLNKRKDVLIRVPVYVLIDYNTVSATERALLGLKESERTTFIGSNTAGAAGFVCKTKITDSITLVYTTGKFVGFDDNPMSYQGIGIAPDIYVYPTPQGIAAERDEVLEKAIEVALKDLEKNE